MIHTKYESLTDEQLADLFHSSNWNNNMSPDDRLAACQEVVNRDALSQGMVPCEVVATDMRGNDFGVFTGSTIEVNGHILSSGQIMDEDGNLTAFPGSNAETLNTLYHENRHAYDAQLSAAIEDKMAGNAYNHSIIEDAEARGLDIDQIRASDSIYVQSTDGYDLYRVQNSEREAYKAGEEGCAKMFEGSQSRLGADAEYQAYSDRLAAEDGYNEAMANLKDVYKDENFDKTLDEQAKNLYFSDHKKDSEFEHGTPESRGAAKNIVENTRGAIYVGMNNSLGYTNDHYNANANANAANVGAANTGGANAAAGGNVPGGGGAKASSGAAAGSQAAGEENAAASSANGGLQAGYRADDDDGAAGGKGGGAHGALSGSIGDDASVSSAEPGGGSAASDGGEGGNSGSNDDEDADC